jgi:nicotinate-nucleotide pyrophosphorylase (carboxylating)
MENALATAITENCRAALAEDMGTGDLTAQLLPAEQTATAQVTSRAAAVLAGRPWFEACFRALDPTCTMTWLAADGEDIEPGMLLVEVSGNARALLTAERPALNFLQTLSAIATQTHQFVDAIAGTRAHILDTRKTLPGLRIASKYAVRMGGGDNQRIGLFDGILLKENHIAAAGGIGAALAAARRLATPDITLQIEVETLSELNEALDAGATLILLDNFRADQLREAVEINAGRAQLEASGGVDIDTVRAIARTGVDRISIGALTKNIRAIDLSMRFI